MTSRRGSRPYDVLGAVYDQAAHDEISAKFAAALTARFPHLLGTGPILDVGCGTGALTRRLARSGAPIVGVDLSSGALAVARRRCRSFDRVRFVHGDMTASLGGPTYRLAVACGDVMNHLEPTAARRALRSLRRCLVSGGHLVFDTLTKFCFEAYWADRDYHLEGASGDVVMECDWDPMSRIGTARMIVFAKQPRGRYERSVTTLHEHWHAPADVRRWLRAAGFAAVSASPWSPWDGQDREPDYDRTLWVARVA